MLMEPAATTCIIFEISANVPQHLEAMQSGSIDLDLHNLLGYHMMGSIFNHHKQAILNQVAC